MKLYEQVFSTSVELRSHKVGWGWLVHSYGQLSSLSENSYWRQVSKGPGQLVINVRWASGQSCCQVCRSVRKVLWLEGFYAILYMELRPSNGKELWKQFSQKLKSWIFGLQMKRYSLIIDGRGVGTHFHSFTVCLYWLISFIWFTKKDLKSH